MSYLFIMFANGVDPSLNKWVLPCWIAMALYLVCKLFRFFLTATQHRRRKHAQKYRDRLRARLKHERTFIRYEISESDEEDHEGTDWEVPEISSEFVTKLYFKIMSPRSERGSCKCVNKRWSFFVNGCQRNDNKF